MPINPQRQGAVEANRQLWDRWTDVHVGSDFYDVDRFRAGGCTLCPIELAEIGDVDGKRLLHLQCHFGLDTLSWARRGARVTGVDLSPKAIDTAEALALELDIEAEFLSTDIYELPEALQGSFDLIFTSYGVLPWLPDLDAWAQIIAHFLAPGGAFHLVEFHPLLDTFDDAGKPFVHPYFPTGEASRFEEVGTYADPSAKVEGTSHIWPHSLGEIVTALARADLQLDFLHEHAESPYDCFPFTEMIAPGRAAIPGLEGRAPLLFSLRARHP